MVWYIIAGIAAALALGILIFNFIRDRRYDRKRGLDIMGPELRKAVEEERDMSLRRKERFQEALGDAMEKEEGPNSSEDGDIS